ncbi:hypothetical protein EON81_01760 [bacterium]|nr:MAG: hypothetical protein EON81_01760 [bacterium]
MFPFGRILATPGALDMLVDLGLDPLIVINRHLWGDWGDLDEQDRASNERALNHGGRLFSSYDLEGARTSIWVITEADRSCTTLLLPSEY